MKNKYMWLPLFAVMIMVAFSSCKSSKKIDKVTGAQEISLPLSGKEYQTNDEFFRARQSGKSPDLAFAKKIALQNANAEMASMVKKTVQKVMDQYSNQRTVGTSQEFENKTEELAREVVNQSLSGTRIIGEKVFQEQDKAYTYWVVVEMPAKNIEEAASNKISNEAKLKLDYDEKLFREQFQKALKDLQKEQGY
ncbi:MAG: hypothetical protein ACKOA1_00535 [Bacteroidota bacterium]